MGGVAQAQALTQLEEANHLKPGMTTVLALALPLALAQTKTKQPRCWQREVSRVARGGPGGFSYRRGTGGRSE